MVATMDAICSGRFIFGVGLGYREEEYAAFGVKREERVPRMVEALEVMKLLWTGEDVEFHGRFYEVPKVTSTVRCVQNPHPPIWVAANNDAAIRRAGRLGYAWLINPHATVATIAAQMGTYQAALETSDAAGPVAVPMMREMYVAEDREVAMYESRPRPGPVSHRHPRRRRLGDTAVRGRAGRHSHDPPRAVAGPGAGQGHEATGADGRACDTPDSWRQKRLRPELPGGRIHMWAFTGPPFMTVPR